MSKRTLLFLFCIIAIAATLRLYGITWDQGFNMHPDERAIILFSLPLHFPATLQAFFTPNSPLNPHFFAYGSLPLYLLKAVASLITIITKYPIDYGNIAIVGRLISAIADLGTLLVVFLIGKKLFSEKTGLVSALCYALATFSIQVSHFYAVDTLLTFFITTVLYTLLRFYENPTVQMSLLIGIFFGMALATKDSALALLSAIGCALVADFALLFYQKERMKHIRKLLMNMVIFGLIISFTTTIVFFIFEPYAFLDFSSFWMQTMQQAQMTHNAYTFPYTLQYVGKIPYLYEIHNIFFWGLGPSIATFSGIGLMLIFATIYKKPKKEKWAQETILITFFFAYCIVVGKFAIGFMRYMLPIYPLLTIFAGVAIIFLMRIFTRIRFTWITIGISLYVLVLLSYWPLSFIHIYSAPNTRTQATTWILNNIPAGSTIAVEHWDDSLPLLNQQEYNMVTLPLYDPDTQRKWQAINATLAKTNYIIIASNRLYVPLQKLADCKKYSLPYCYPLTDAYYKKLFSGELGFSKVAEFAIYPTIPLTNIRINDQTADESFTVYDHPKVMIFERTP